MFSSVTKGVLVLNVDVEVDVEVFVDGIVVFGLALESDWLKDEVTFFTDGDAPSPLGEPHPAIIPMIINAPPDAAIHLLYRFT